MLAVVKFIIFVFFFLYLPGKAVLGWARVKLGSPDDQLAAIVVGIAGLVLLSFVFGWLGLRRILVLGLLIIAFWQLKKGWLDSGLRKWRWPGGSWVWGLIIFATIYQSLVMISSGRNFQGGIAFWGVNGHDGLWHLTLIQELAQTKKLPGQNPGYFGENLKNYHFFYDLLVAETHRVTRIPIINLFFQFYPLFLGFLLNSLVYLFAYRWSKKRGVAFWAVFFVAFASSLGFVLPWFGVGSNNWETAFWAMQPASSLQNPQFFLSLILMTAGLRLLLALEKTKKKLPLILVLALVFGVIMEVKVYGGLVVIAALGLTAFWHLLTKKSGELVMLLGLTLILGFGTYLPASQATTGFIKWEPFWFIRTMIQAGDRVNWVSWELRRQVYAAHYNWMGILLVDGVALGIFFLGNFGTRIIGAGAFLKKLIKPRLTALFLIGIVIAGVVPPLFFLQEYLAWNTIQFFYYAIFAFSFFAALGADFWLTKLSKSWQKLILVGGILFFSLPSGWQTISWHWSDPPTSILDKSEKAALEWLNSNSDKNDLILAFPYQPGVEKVTGPPVPLSYYNAAYISFFANRYLYLEDQTVAQIQGYGLEERLTRVKRFFASTDPQEANQFLAGNQIKYIYLVDHQKWQADLENQVDLVYKNDRVQIYHVKINS